MIKVSSIYNDAALDDANKDSNGDFSFEMFNRISRRAELRLIDWLSGSVDGISLPAAYTTQKNRDWLSTFIVKNQAQVVDSYIDKPLDYYQNDNFYRIGSKVTADCDQEAPEDNADTPIDMLGGAEFNRRLLTHIEEMAVTLEKPVSKLFGKKIQVAPKDLGSVCLEYIRYPKYGEIVSKLDTQFNEMVIDETLSTDYEWEEAVRPMLIWFITDTYANHIRETALKQFNAASRK